MALWPLGHLSKDAVRARLHVPERCSWRVRSGLAPSLKFLGPLKIQPVWCCLRLPVNKTAFNFLPFQHISASLSFLSVLSLVHSQSGKVNISMYRCSWMKPTATEPHDEILTQKRNTVWGRKQTNKTKKKPSCKSIDEGIALVFRHCVNRKTQVITALVACFAFCL